MLDAKQRLLDARQALHHLALKTQQYRIHIAELADRHEVERARKVLDKLQADLGAQGRYCAKAEEASRLETKSGSAHAA
jgi:hypothetical protein